MNFIDLISNYRGTATFSRTPVPERTIRRAVSATHANSGMLKVKTISDSQAKTKIRCEAERIERAYLYGAGNGNFSEAGWRKPFLEEASHLVVFSSKMGQPYLAASTWLSVGNVIVAAASLGLGTICYAPTMPPLLRRPLDIPPGFMPIVILTVGYPGEELFADMWTDELNTICDLVRGRLYLRKK